MIPPPGIFSDAEWARLSEEITAYGGFNPRGEPLYRLVWGGTRTCLRVGVWEGGEIETRQTPKYLTALNRFVMEVWCPPEYFGSPRSWEESTRTEIDGAVVYALGEFPHRGDYEGIEVYQHPRICDCGTPMKKWDWGPKNLIHRRREEHVITKSDGTWDVIQGDWMPHQKPMSCGICGESTMYIKPTFWHAQRVINLHRATIEANKEEIVKLSEQARRKDVRAEQEAEARMGADLARFALTHHTKTGYGPLNTYTPKGA